MEIDVYITFEGPQGELAAVSFKSLSDEIALNKVRTAMAFCPAGWRTVYKINEAEGERPNVPPTKRQFEIVAESLRDLAHDFAFTDESVGIGGNPESAEACRQVYEFILQQIKGGTMNIEEIIANMNRKTPEGQAVLARLDAIAKPLDRRNEPPGWDDCFSVSPFVDGEPIFMEAETFKKANVNNGTNIAKVERALSLGATVSKNKAGGRFLRIVP